MAAGIEAHDFHTRRVAERQIPIFTCDGGGIRGIIPCKVLSEIERRTKKSATENFRLFAGTSTGALMALGLNVPNDSNPDVPKYTPEDLLKVYTEQGKSIFPVYYGEMFWRLTHPKYDGKGLEAVLSQYLGETKLRESIREVAVTSYDIFNQKPFQFTKRTDPDLTMYTAALRSTAAPTYFPSRKGPNGENFVDGGMSANNPALVAYSVGRGIFGNPENFLICSLGTGKELLKLSYDDSGNAGLIYWGRQFFDVSFDTQEAEVEEMMRTLYPKSGKDCQYYRFQTTIDEIHTSLDDSSDGNIAYLLETSESLIEEKGDEINELVMKLDIANRDEKYAVQED